MREELYFIDLIKTNSAKEIKIKLECHIVFLKHIAAFILEEQRRSSRCFLNIMFSDIILCTKLYG